MGAWFVVPPSGGFCAGPPKGGTPNQILNSGGEMRRNASRLDFAGQAW